MAALFRLLPLWLRRALFQLFLMFACVRMLRADRHRWRDWMRAGTTTTGAISGTPASTYATSCRPCRTDVLLTIAAPGRPKRLT